MNKYICYVAGKSGGHIIPALTHAQNVLRENPELNVLFFSTNSALDRSLLEHNKLINTYKPLDLANVPRKKILAWPGFLYQFTKVLFQTFTALRRHRPLKVVSMGGYVSIPVCLVARLLRIPCEVYELNVVPGEAVKLLSKYASVTHTCFSETKKYLPAKAHCQVSSYPLRYTAQDNVTRHAACEALSVDADKKIMCVLGGSQGSRFINELMQAYVLHSADNREYVIIHQTGTADVEAVKDFYQKQAITALVFAYRNDIHLCYAAADVIVARAGAGTLFEILFFQKPSIIIPLETATTNHQKDNALTMQVEHPEFFKVLLQGEIEQNTLPFFKDLASFLPKKAI